jgi:hypothetical protein
MNQMNGLLFVTGIESLRASEAHYSRPSDEAARQPAEIWTPRSRSRSTLRFFFPAALAKRSLRG